MRTLTIEETNDVSGGTFGLLALLFCAKPKTNYCAPAPKCDPAPKCAPAPKCDPKPKHC